MLSGNGENDYGRVQARATGGRESGRRLVLEQSSRRSPFGCESKPVENRSDGSFRWVPANRSNEAEIADTERQRTLSGVALEFRTVELREDLPSGLVQAAASLGGDTATLALGGLDEVELLELLEDRSNDVSRAVGALVGGDLVAVRAAFGAAVLGRQALDADGTVVGDFSKETRRADRPEVLLLWGKVSVDAVFRERCPLRLLEVVFEVVGERLDERFRRDVVHRSHWVLVPACAI